MLECTLVRGPPRPAHRTAAAQAGAPANQFPEASNMGVLSGIRVIEIAGIGPGPFCGMLLADMGAEVILVERPPQRAVLEFGPHAIIHRGKRSLKLDLKRPGATEVVLRLVASADALIEGMRPGVMEKLGLGPEPCLARNPRLVYGRMTGWGQDGPYALRAGHDINYIGIAGAAWYAGAPGTPPLPPPTLVGDLGGGALYLALGLLGALLAVRAGQPGQVVDAAIVDGSANLMNLLLSLHGAGLQPMERGRGLLDGPYWYGCYACADALYLSVGALEPQFHAILVERLGLSDDPDFAQPYDAARWPRLRARLQAIFAAQPRQHWLDRFEGSDACVAAVLDPGAALHDPHLAARGVYSRRDGLLQAAPAPRFSATPSHAGAVPACGADGEAILRELGYATADIEALL
jgi:crotonobetainyl-CoA:carnitine CoA-transferase CaiB-like acyl-CoA transferase